jgi:hypothetical protein
VTSTIKTHQKPPGYAKNGFVLLEALLAMGLMMGAWMALLQGYQTLSLKLMQEEQEKVRLTKEWDASELSIVGKAINSEPSRMSSGSRTLHATAQPTTQIKR